MVNVQDQSATGATSGGTFNPFFGAVAIPSSNAPLIIVGVVVAVIAVAFILKRK